MRVTSVTVGLFIVVLRLALVRQEIADVFIYLTRHADKLGVDVEKAVLDKIALNEKKYLFPEEDKKSPGVINNLAKLENELDCFQV